MAGQNEQERHDRWKALGIRTDTPHPARVYDYLLGGKDNFGVDREAAEMSLKISPEILDSARANRKFLVRSVRFLRDNGIRQFHDVGTSLSTIPSRGSWADVTEVSPGVVSWRPRSMLLRSRIPFSCS